MLQLAKDPGVGGKYFVLNASLKDMFSPVIKNQTYFNLVNDGKALAGKQVILLDENAKNKRLAEALKSANHSYFDYEVWQTDHPFTNKRISLINKVLAFLNR